MLVAQVWSCWCWGQLEVAELLLCGRLTLLRDLFVLILCLIIFLGRKVKKPPYLLFKSCPTLLISNIYSFNCGLFRVTSNRAILGSCKVKFGEEF